jgi:hypothetical protein
MPLQLRDKSDFIPKLTTNARRRQVKSVQHHFFPPVIRWSLRSDPNPRSSIFKLKPSMADQAIQVNFIPLRFIRYYLSDSLLRFPFPPFLDRSYPRSFWFTLRTTQHLISSVLWESLIPASLLKPNPGESPSKRLYQGPSCGKTLSRTGPCPQLQARETGTRGYSQITVQKPATGTPFAFGKKTLPLCITITYANQSSLPMRSHSQ